MAFPRISPHGAHAVAIAVLLALVGTGGATHDVPDCESMPGSSMYLPPGAREGTFSPAYVAVDDPPNHDMTVFGVWIYVEQNLEPGLQRHDAWCQDRDASGRPYSTQTADLIVF